MAGPATSAALSSDQEKFLASDLITRTMLKLVCAQACQKVQQPKGMGTTANFVRYKRMNVPTVPLSETGTDPTSSSFSIDTVAVTLDQWGDVLDVTDVAILATFHPVLEQMTELLSDNAQRVIDREIQIVWLAGTNVQFFDGSIVARSSITNTMLITDKVIHKAKVTLANAGAPPFTGPNSNASNDAKQQGQIKSVRGGNAYLAITSPGVMSDIQSTGTSLGTWASVAMYANQQALYNSEVGSWLGFRWVESNFLPAFTLLGNTTTALTTGGNSMGITGLTTATATTGGSLSNATYNLKVTRKDLLRGFEEAITIEHTWALAGGTATQTMAFTFPATAGFAYNVYLGTTTGDANLFLAASNQAAGSTFTLTTAIPATGANPPQSLGTSNTPTSVRVIFCVGNGWCGWVSLQNLQFYLTKDESYPGAVLRLKRQAGYKFLAKSIILDQNKGLRIELASTYE